MPARPVSRKIKETAGAPGEDTDSGSEANRNAEHAATVERASRTSHAPTKAGVVERARSQLRLLWKRAQEEHASPRDIGWAVAIGVFAGCTPGIGIHGWIALGLATLFRKNRLWTWIGSRISNMFVLPWIILLEIQVAHRVRTGAWVTVAIDDVLDRAQELLLDWCLGTFPVGFALGAVFGLLAFAIARYRARRADERDDVRPRDEPRTLAPRRERSSEPPPSG